MREREREISGLLLVREKGRNRATRRIQIGKKREREFGGRERRGQRKVHPAPNSPLRALRPPSLQYGVTYLRRVK